MKYLKSIVKRSFRILSRLMALCATLRLRRGEVASRLLGDALKETFQNDLMPDEEEWINRLEILRGQLNSSVSKVQIVDFGAGESGLHVDDKAKKEKDEGIVVAKTVGEISKSSSKPYFWSLLLFKLVRKFRPSFCLELGTCLGVSASFLAAALKLNGAGNIVSLEGAESLAVIAKGNLQTLDLNNAQIVIGRFQDTLNEVLSAHKPVDFAFIDGHHDEKATLEYYQQILCCISPRAILVFDDISWSKGMKRAWKTILADERVRISLDLSQLGVCIIDNSIKSKENIAIRSAII